MTITYAKETLATWRPDAEPLLVKHWDEVATYKDIALSPEWDWYEKAETMGVLAIYTARDAGILIGYTLYFCRASHHHYSQASWAVNDICFIAPEYRRKGAAKGLFDFAETDLQRRGVMILQYHVKTAHPELAIMLAARGFAHVEDVYSKRLG